MATSLTRDDVIKIAHLARIELTEDEIANFQKELSAIIDYVAKLSDVDIEGLKPTNQVTGLSNVWREDELIDYGYKPETLLANVPQKDGGYIKVKRMVE